MKNILSNWSGRLISLLVPVALLAISFAPVNALASKEISEGRDGRGGGEGDPLDTNDCGGGGGGSDIHDDAGNTNYHSPQVFGLDKFQVILVPEVLGGTLIFKVLLVPREDSGLTSLSMEEYHAP